MKKTYKIDVDCANCANKMEAAARATEGVRDATVNFMTLKMIVEFEDGSEPKAVMEAVRSGGNLENIGGSSVYSKDIVCPDGCVIFRMTAKKRKDGNFFNCSQPTAACISVTFKL